MSLYYCPGNQNPIGIENMRRLESDFPAVSFELFKERIWNDTALLKAFGFEVTYPDALAEIYSLDTEDIANLWLRYTNKQWGGAMCMWHYRHCPQEDLDKRVNRIVERAKK